MLISLFLKQFSLSLIIFLVIDLPWIGFLGKRSYDAWLSPFARTIRLVPAFGTYVLLALGVSLFVLPLSGGSPLKAMMYGALFGAITYGVYDLTNYAVLAKYPLAMTLVDWAWGALLCAFVSFLVCRISPYL